MFWVVFTFYWIFMVAHPKPFTASLHSAKVTAEETAENN